MTIAELRRNGSFKCNGREYVLTQQIYLSNGYYRSTAICVTDEIDEDGWQPAYDITYVILDNYDPEIMEEDMACNWDDPEDIKECGEYSLAENRHM